jgi:hypothetical protein
VCIQIHSLPGNPAACKLHADACCLLTLFTSDIVYTAILSKVLKHLEGGSPGAGKNAGTELLTAEVGCIYWYCLHRGQSAPLIGRKP